MRVSRICAMSIAVVAVAVGLAGCPDSRPLFAVGVIEDQPYAQGYVSDSLVSQEYYLRELLLDVYFPEDSDRTDKVAVVMLHGGSFVEGGKDKEQVVEQARFLASRGMTAFAINYRLNGDYPPAPGNWDIAQRPRAVHAAFVDAKAAVRFVRANAEVYGIDPEKIVIWGESAGAIAAVATAVTAAGKYAQDGDAFPVPEVNHPGVSSAVAGCVNLWGGTLGGLLLLDLDPRDPPMMILHGEDDDTLLASFREAELLRKALELLRIPHEFYAIPNTGHGAWDARVRGRNLKLLVQDFINEHVGR